MKKILSLILALLMAFSAASMIAAAEEAAIAEEPAAATATGEYAEAIKFLQLYGIYKGKSATDLAEEDDIERYQMALFVARIATGWTDDDRWEDRDHNSSEFTDLDGTPAQNYYGAISYANQKGIIIGYGNGKFGPTDGINYQNALTMVVRTLGYQNLAWPWGYIEKAVNLGLTKGIPADVAYTQVLNRGQVAQIIYNALFTPTKDGDTLAARNFDGELGWETIIITAAGKGKYDANDPTSVPGGAIAFKTVKADGTLNPETYFVKNADSFQFPEHKELKVGYAYKALFTKDTSSQFVTLVSFVSNYDDIVWNFGLPTYDGNYPIQKFLSGYSLVTKYSKNTYLGNKKDLYGIAGGFTEMIIRSGIEGDTITEDGERRYAINWLTGDILENTGKVDDDGNTIYKTAWYFNPVLRQYYQVKTKQNVDGDLEVIGINFLDSDDQLGSKFLQTTRTITTGMKFITKISKTAYASLKYFTILDADKPNYGIYEEYRLGLFSETSVDCASCGAKKQGFVVYSLDAVAKQTWLEYKEDPATWGPYTAVAAVKEGGCDHGIAWISEEGYTPEDGDYIIYNYDPGTGELKVVKIINDKTADKDNFVATGVVRAYNVKARTVTIGDTKYNFDYNDLAGTGLYLNDGDGKDMERAKFTDLFRSLFNQFVNFVVVDGKLVYIEAANDSAELIVVDSYAGLSSDGYIVVNGYDTKNLYYSQFRIGSYNGWVKGDYYYYLTEKAVEDSFTRGSLYRITSYDPDLDVYYVYTVAKSFITEEIGNSGAYEVYGMTYDIAELQELGVIGTTQYSIVFGDGYKSINGGDATKAKTTDRYVLICNPIDNYFNYKGEEKLAGGDYAPIIVYSGKGAAGWSVNGYQVKGTSATVLIGVDFDSVVGFNKDQYDLSYVLFLGYDYETASYNGADNTDDWYLLGASTFTCRVFNLYTGEVQEKIATNKDLRKGYAYPSINGVIVNDAKYGAWRLNVSVPGAYLSGKIYRFADHRAASDDFKAWKNDYFDKGNFSKSILSVDFGKSITIGGKTIPVGDLSDGGVKVFLVRANADGKIESLMGVNKDQLNAWVAENEVDLSQLGFWYIYDVEAGKTVVYIGEGDALKADVETAVSWDTSNLVNVSTAAADAVEDDPETEEDESAAATVENDAYISASVKGTETVDPNTGKYLSATVTGIGFEFLGKAIAITGPNDGDTHHAIDVNDFHFGMFGECNYEYWKTVVSDGTTDQRIYGTVVETPYAPHNEEEYYCILVRAIAFALDTPITLDLDETTDDPDTVTLTVTFTDSGDFAAAPTDYSFDIVITLTEDGITVEFDSATITNGEGNVLTIGDPALIDRPSGDDYKPTLFVK